VFKIKVKTLKWVIKYLRRQLKIFMVKIKMNKNSGCSRMEGCQHVALKQATKQIGISCNKIE